MSKKEKTAFDLNVELETYPKPEFMKRAFIKTVDISKIKNKSDLDKEFKKYEELQL